MAADSKDAAAIAARQRLSAALAELNPGAGFKGEGSGRGDKTKKGKTAAAPDAKPATTSSVAPAAGALDPVAAERAAKFDRLDKAKTGKLTREYYTANQSDAVAAAERFEKMDTNKDGFVTREEYISNGKQQK